VKHKKNSHKVCAHNNPLDGNIYCFLCWKYIKERMLDNWLATGKFEEDNK